MANITTSETSAVSLDIISQYVQAYLWQNAILMNTIIDRTPEAVPGVKQIDVGRRSQLTAVPKVADTPLTSQKITWASDPLVLNLHEAVYTVLEDAADVEAMVGQEPAILESATQALLTSLEAAIYTAIAACSATTPDHRVRFKTNSVISIPDILNARKLLNKANVPMMDRWMAVNPDEEETVLSLKNIIEPSKYPESMVIVNGEIGRILGFRCVVTNAVTAGTSMFYHRSHVAYARQIVPTWEKGRKLSEVATEFLLNQKYGVKTLDGGKRGVLMNNTGS
jgi:hypothetical protein